MTPSLTSSSSTGSLSSSLASSSRPIAQRQRSVLWTSFSFILKALVGSFTFYKFLASPPFHWFYDPLPPLSTTTTNSNATRSLYLPGGGFSGLFYHLGFLDSLTSPQQLDYYCYSSGCIAAVAALTHLSLEDTTDAGLATQAEWMAGRISIYEFAEQFVVRLLQTVDDERLQTVLPQIRVLVTSPWHGGTELLQATHRDEFVRLMITTTWLYVFLF